MSDIYSHGAYAIFLPSGITITAKSGTLPVYFGAAPTHQLMEPYSKTGEPLLLESYAQALERTGYSDNWVDFSLGEALHVHFRSGAPIGPIVVVNVFDPATHRKETSTSAEVLFVAGRGRLPDDLAILSTIAIEGKTLGTDFTAAHEEGGAVVVITDPVGSLSGKIQVTYTQADPFAITEEEMAAAIRKTVGQVYELSGKIPTLLAAPGWSENKMVNDALKEAAAKISGHWDAFVVDDLDTEAYQTIDAAIPQKEAEFRTSASETPCWPMGTDGSRYYHLSTLSIAKMMEVDAANGDIPFETCSNKPIGITGLVVKDGEGGYRPIRFDQTEANRLNAAGIRTAIFWGGKYRLWGPHTGAYNYDAGNTPEEIFDCSVRMAQYLGNSFQLAYGDEVDKPVHRSRIDTILNAVQEGLDRLVNLGALLYGKISFQPDSNPDSDMMSGEFVFDTGYTTTPPAKAIINRYRYTSQGLEALTGGDGI